VRWCGGFWCGFTGMMGLGGMGGGGWGVVNESGVWG